MKKDRKKDQAKKIRKKKRNTGERRKKIGK